MIIISTSSNLYKARKGGVYKILSVPDNKLLQNMGIRVGVNVLIKNRYTFGGPVLLCVENSFNVAIGKDIAAQILVGREIFSESRQAKK